MIGKTTKKLNLIAIILTLLIGTGAAAAQVDPAISKNWGKVCGSPDRKKCSISEDYFQPYDIIFDTGRMSVTDGMQATSNEFYAIVLKTVEIGSQKCRIVGEDERLKTQKLFPGNKVFASHYGCPKSYANYMDYDAPDSAGIDSNFMAVYAGATKAQATKFNLLVKKNFPNAELKRFKISFETDIKN